MKVQDYSDIVSGFAFKSKLFNTEGTGTPIIRIRDVGQDQSNTFFNGGFDSKYLIKRGDYLIAMDGEFRMCEWKGPPSLLNQRVCKINFDDNIVDKRYMLYGMPFELKRIEDTTSFVTVKHLSVKKIRAIELPLPDLPTQRKIAHRLDLIDRLRQSLRAEVAAYGALGESLFLEMFGDSSKYIKAKFGDVVETRLGKMLDKRKQHGNRQKKYLRNANVQWFKFELEDLKTMDIERDEEEKYGLRKGDVLLCEGGEIGRAAIWNDEIEDCYYQKALHRARVKEDRLVSIYLVFWLYHQSKTGGFDDFSSSATITHLTGAKLKKIQISLPPLQQQQTFATRIAEIERLKAKAEAALAEAEDLFAAVLQGSFG